MLKNIAMIVIVSWACSSFCMHTEAQKEEFRSVAAHLGFKIEALKLEFSKSGKTMHTCQDFGPGYIFLRVREGQYKIASGALAEPKTIEERQLALATYQQTEWLTLSQALAYVPDMKEKK
jgi:hypothetical protein